MVLVFETLKSFFENLLTYAGPIIIILFTLAILAGLVKWSWRTKEWLSIVSSNPILLVIFLGLSIFGIIMLYNYIIPLINK